MVVIPVLCLAPFLTKAFHIDDTVFLWAAEQIQLNLVDFYGFSANWNGFDLPMFDINKNPPFVSYYIAAVALIFGFNEVALHLAFLIPAVGISLGTYYLARPYCKIPHLASLIAVATPVFVVSSSNVMSDTMMVFFYVTASALWIRGIEEENTICLFAASILITLAVLSKYFGITLIPLLLVYSLMVKRRLGRCAGFDYSFGRNRFLSIHDVYLYGKVCWVMRQYILCPTGLAMECTSRSIC